MLIEETFCSLFCGFFRGSKRAKFAVCLIFSDLTDGGIKNIYVRDIGFPPPIAEDVCAWLFSICNFPLRKHFYGGRLRNGGIKNMLDI